MSDPAGQATWKMVVLDTDIGTDPDDVVALLTALALPEAICVRLALVVSANDNKGMRANMAQCLLADMGRPDVPVVAGVDGGSAAASSFLCEDVQALCSDKGHKHSAVVPCTGGAMASSTHASAHRCDFIVSLDALAKECCEQNNALHYVSIGGLTNLKHALEHSADRATLVEAMGKRAYVMGGCTSNSYKKAEFNIRLDVAAARDVFSSELSIWLVPSSTTVHDNMKVEVDHPLFDAVNGNKNAAGILSLNFKNFTATFPYGCFFFHDPLTLVASLQEDDSEVAADEKKATPSADASTSVGPFPWARTTMCIAANGRMAVCNASQHGASVARKQTCGGCPCGCCCYSDRIPKGDDRISPHPAHAASDCLHFEVHLCTPLSDDQAAKVSQSITSMIRGACTPTGGD